MLSKTYHPSHIDTPLFSVYEYTEIYTEIYLPHDHSHNPNLEGKQGKRPQPQ